MSRQTAPHYTSHNPAGGYAVVALLLLALITPLTGWLTFNDWGGKWLEKSHEALANLFLLAIAVHLIGVTVESIAHRESLPRSMVTGVKQIAHAEEGITSPWRWGVVPLAIAALTGAWWAIQ
jgi:cytochrome b